MLVLSGALLPSEGASGSSSNSSSSVDTLLDTCPGLPHLHRATAQGGLCLLTVRDDSPAGEWGCRCQCCCGRCLDMIAHAAHALCAAPADACSELAQLLGAYEVSV
jgi:hypothetical protein